MLVGLVLGIGGGAHGLERILVLAFRIEHPGARDLPAPQFRRRRRGYGDGNHSIVPSELDSIAANYSAAILLAANAIGNNLGPSSTWRAT
jgi:hypothetical protein